MEGAQPLSMNAYKVQMFPVAIYRTVLLAAGQMGRDRGPQDDLQGEKMMSATETALESSRRLAAAFAPRMPTAPVRSSAENWLPGVRASSSYWCLLTQGPAGPDENYVHLARCGSGRSCYAAPEDGVSSTVERKI